MVAFLSPSSPYIINARSLWNIVGSDVYVLPDIIAPTRIGVDLISTPEGSTVSCDFSIQSVSEGMLFTGEIISKVQSEYARCLRGVNYELQCPITQLYIYEGLHDNQMNIEQSVIPHVRDKLPPSLLCGSQYAGLYSPCGIDRNESLDYSHENIDSHCAALKNFFSSDVELP